MRNIDFDPYTTLGLNHNATKSEIRMAYKKLALKHHPDRCHNHNTSGDDGGEGKDENENHPSAEDKMAKINEAYSILKDDEKKRNFDYLYRYGGLQIDGSNNGSASADRRTSSAATSQKFRYRNHMRRKDSGTPFAHDPFFQTTTSSSSHMQRSRSTTGNRGKGGSSFSFTSSSSQYKPETGERIHTRRTTRFQNGTKHLDVETTTIRPDGTSEINVTSHSEENATVMGHFVKGMFGLNNTNEQSNKNGRNDISSSQRSMESKKLPWYENVCANIKKCVG